MFAKLLAIILTLGATGCALLVIRQHRIDTVHEMSTIHQRLLGHERTLWELRSEIAKRCRPSQVRLAMNQTGGTWVPIPASPPPFDQPALHLATAHRSPNSETPR
jgi:hypothetical protein